MARENPYKPGGACYLAYEAGYTDALLDAMETMKGCDDYVKRDHAAGNVAGLPGISGKMDAYGQQEQNGIRSA